MPHDAPPRALVIRTAGINCDTELCRAFELAGAMPELVHVDALLADASPIRSADLIAFPGGFSYGDDIASGRILAMRTREHLLTPLRDAVARGAPIIGICNGFQVLVQLGLVPGEGSQSVALAENGGARFLDDWVGVDLDDASPCVWTRGIAERYEHDEHPHAMQLPFAHGEGRFVAASDAAAATLGDEGRVPMRYASDVNGSMDRIAGLCDQTGLVFGLMPHPERFLEWNRHPYWTRLPASLRAKPTPGLLLFQNAVRAVQPSAAV